ncbi:hypothetical protein PBV87_08115 [Niameybacter massiliensis]|uniref:Uncharacterized protein n=1 Tax=Holtiella tumoricola TaxID=3018743 RepID=A0AA42DM42_9FIRM|nr:hypothetical protein [Holtiella tumoricola]MDA3731440.1 hypothetical protein [Holtiella tumoricola]
MDFELEELINKFKVRREEYVRISENIYRPLQLRKIEQELQLFLEGKEFTTENNVVIYFDKWKLVHDGRFINFSNVKTLRAIGACLECAGDGQSNDSYCVSLNRNDAIFLDSTTFEYDLARLRDKRDELIEALKVRILHFERTIEYINNHREIADYTWEYWCNNPSKEFKSIADFFEFANEIVG